MFLMKLFIKCCNKNLIKVMVKLLVDFGIMCNLGFFNCLCDCNDMTLVTFNKCEISFGLITKLLINLLF